MSAFWITHPDGKGEKVDAETEDAAEIVFLKKHGVRPVQITRLPYPWCANPERCGAGHGCSKRCGE